MRWQRSTKGRITPGHARALLGLVNVSDQQVLLRRVIEKGLSVRETEEMAGALNRGKKGAQRDRTGAGRQPCIARSPMSATWSGGSSRSSEQRWK